MKILFFGDIVGRPGREAIKKILPQWKNKYQPDIIIANGENSAHGSGISQKGAEQIFESGVDLITLGDHAWSQPQTKNLLEKYRHKIIRPANFPPHLPGTGYGLVEIRTKKILVINLIGRVFMKQNYDDPIRSIDQILEQYDNETNGIIVDFHAEATAEKVCLGWYLDGRVSAVLGTHTHIPTADEKILPQGAAYITDVGMVGFKESSLGANKEKAIQSLLDQTPFQLEIDKQGPVEINAVLVELNPKKIAAKKIKRIKETINI